MTIKNKHDLALYSVNCERARRAETKMSKDIKVLDVAIADVVDDLS